MILPDHHPACHRRYGCYCPHHHTRTASLVSHASCFTSTGSMGNARACSTVSRPAYRARSPKPRRICWRRRRIPCRRCRAPGNTGGTRGVIVLVCEHRILPSIPRPSVSGAVHGGCRHRTRGGGDVELRCKTRWRGPWGINFVSGVQKKVLPYRSPRKTLRAQASVASGPARTTAHTTPMCRPYSPAILQSSEARVSVRGDGYPMS
ncbi:hypothetical protein C8J57DRAFT_111419 [Mycena rebaudengoi]|nr:hypothetical protein C8J57DRAFT_111419 [Mycena rebaudengoi]